MPILGSLTNEQRIITNIIFIQQNQLNKISTEIHYPLDFWNSHHSQFQMAVQNIGYKCQDNTSYKFYSTMRTQLDQIQEQSQSIQFQKATQQEENQEQQHQKQQSYQQDQSIKWDYLEHKGVIFQDLYSPSTSINAYVLYQGQKTKLMPQQEELMFYWYQTSKSPQASNPLFLQNFKKQFTKIFTDKNFNDFNFDPLFKYFKHQKKKKRTNQPLKALTKQRNIQQEKIYGTCIIDNRHENLACFRIEPPALFRGRGNQHPKAGLLKNRIFPQNITINTSETAPVPICHVKGHCWGNIVSDHSVTWLATHKNPINQKQNRYIYLASDSKLKKDSDLQKYQMARKLKNCIKEIREDYYQNLQSATLKNRQIGTSLYLIDNLALRVGNQVQIQETSDTIGCCSLRVQHISLLENNMIHLMFLGKNSTLYDKIVQVPPIVYKNIEQFMKSKDKSAHVFDTIDTHIINDYLGKLMEGLTAKVFRTYHASSTLQSELKKINEKCTTMELKIQFYNQCVMKVANLCNHQKTIDQKTEKQLENRLTFLQKRRDYLSRLQDHIQQCMNKNKCFHSSQTVKISKNKYYNMCIPMDNQQSKLLHRKEAKRLKSQEELFCKQNQKKHFYVDTSKNSYNDPRISVAWCKKNQVNIQKVFSNTLVSKFFWAMSTDSQWEY